MLFARTNQKHNINPTELLNFLLLILISLLFQTRFCYLCSLLPLDTFAAPLQAYPLKARVQSFAITQDKAFAFGTAVLAVDF